MVIGVRFQHLTKYAKLRENERTSVTTMTFLNFILIIINIKITKRLVTFIAYNCKILYDLIITLNCIKFKKLLNIKIIKMIIFPRYKLQNLMLLFMD